MREIPWWTHVLLGFSVGVFVWAVLCAKARKGKSR